MITLRRTTLTLLLVSHSPNPIFASNGRVINATPSSGNVIVIEREVDLGSSFDRTTIKVDSDVPVTVQRSSGADFQLGQQPGEFVS